MIFIEYKHNNVVNLYSDICRIYFAGVRTCKDLQRSYKAYP